MLLNLRDLAETRLCSLGTAAEGTEPVVDPADDMMGARGETTCWNELDKFDLAE